MLSKSSYLGKKKTKKFLSQNNVISSYFKTKVLILKKKAQKFLFLESLVHAAVKRGPSPQPHRVMERIKCHHVDQN